MTRANIEESLKELNQLVLTGRSREAFEKYYADDVVMQENELPPTIGKEANKLREKEFSQNLIAFRKAEVLNIAIGDNVSCVTWHYDFSHRLWGERKYTQVSVQKWKDGKIINEQFFYGN